MQIDPDYNTFYLISASMLPGLIRQLKARASELDEARAAHESELIERGWIINRGGPNPAQEYAQNLEHASTIRLPINVKLLLQPYGNTVTVCAWDADDADRLVKLHFPYAESWEIVGLSIAYPGLYSINHGKPFDLDEMPCEDDDESEVLEPHEAPVSSASENDLPF